MADIFGISGKAMQTCEDRAVMLTGNIVNASTPKYKARDIDFQKVMQQENANQNAGLITDDARQLSAPHALSAGEQPQYRVPMQSSMDGNTVDEEIERKNFIENALHYQVNLTFVTNKSAELMKAIKGE